MLLAIVARPVIVMWSSFSLCLLASTILSIWAGQSSLVLYLGTAALGVGMRQFQHLHDDNDNHYDDDDDDDNDDDDEEDDNKDDEDDEDEDDVEDDDGIIDDGEDDDDIDVNEDENEDEDDNDDDDGNYDDDNDDNDVDDAGTVSWGWPPSSPRVFFGLNRRSQ